MQYLNINQNSEWYNDVEQTEAQLEFIKYIVGDKFVDRISVVESNEGDEAVLTFRINFNEDDYNDIKNIISKIISHATNPIEGYEQVDETDFTISIESEKLDPISEHLTRLTTFDLQSRINALEYCFDQSFNNSNSNTKRIARLESYLEKTSVLEYANFMHAFVDMLAENNLIDAEKAKSILFPVHH